MNISISRSHFPQLTERQFQVLSRRVMGDSCAEVGGRLDISLRTVEVHQKAVFRKLKVRGVPALIHHCYFLGAIKFQGVPEKN